MKILVAVGAGLKAFQGDLKNIISATLQTSLLKWSVIKI